MKTFKPPKSRYLVPFDGSFDIDKAPTAPGKHRLSGREAEKKLKKGIKAFGELQEVLYADNRYALLLVFQALDAAGKDSTIRAVTTGINPAGFQVFAFKAPSEQELDHDFLWRTSRCLPERGRIGIFNRSYYEEVLVVRVHPEFLAGQRLPSVSRGKAFWRERCESIADHEKHLARNGVVVLKFFLNVSRKEQHARFLRRLEKPDKNWKFSAADLEESRLWDRYMRAYEDALRATSRPWAPWYAIPADDKPTMRCTVAEVIVDQLKSLDLRYPQLSKKAKGDLAAIKASLEQDA